VAPDGGIEVAAGAGSVSITRAQFDGEAVRIAAEILRDVGAARLE
jgi:hypothetical protein